MSAIILYYTPDSQAVPSFVAALERLEALAEAYRERPLAGTRRALYAARRMFKALGSRGAVAYINATLYPEAFS